MNELKNPMKQVSDEEVIVTDFERKIPFWGYRAIKYVPYKPFMELKKELDGYLDGLFKGDIDDGNADCLDLLISDVARMAKKDLMKQRMEHRDLIVSLAIRAESDRLSFEKELAFLQKSLEECEAELENYKQMVAKDEFSERRESK